MAVCSVGSYGDNTVIIQNSLSAAVAGSDEASSTLDVKMDDVNIYNINVKNTYGQGSQVRLSSNATIRAVNLYSGYRRDCER